MALQQGRWNAPRVLTAIGKIGYDPVAAILDIADNSVSNGATRVSIKIETEQELRTGPGRRKAVLSRVTITDDGVGMDAERIDNAIALGSEDSDYSEGTLSKFGMGLKSAASSLG